MAAWYVQCISLHVCGMPHLSSAFHCLQLPSPCMQAVKIAQGEEGSPWSVKDSSLIVEAQVMRDLQPCK